MILIWSVCYCLYSCDNPTLPEPKDPQLNGTGVFSYSAYTPFANKPINVFYHIPDIINSSTPIVFVFHGSGRDGSKYRDAWINKANEYGFMVFAPQFSEAYFPGGDGYNLGNVFIDGDNPSMASLNDESEWTFSVVEPLFDHIKTEMGNATASYHVYGHSAGAQFAHRFMFLKPNARIGILIASAAGWYSVPDNTIDFPYGIANSPIENTDLSLPFSRKLVVIVGELDNDPDAISLRRNSIVDKQGTNRLDRAIHFFERSGDIASDMGSAFLWEFRSLPNVSHNFRFTSEVAADLLFE